MGIIGTSGIVLVGVLWTTSMNWTIVISVIAVSLTGMGTLIGIFGKRVRKEDVIRLQGESKETISKIDALKTAIAEIEKEIATTTQQIKNNEKTIVEMKQDYREIVQRLDDLLKQFMEYLNNSN